MARKISIGIQNFETMRERNCFYIDKTAFIKEWWEQGDEVTLITRPRRFGKTLNMSMIECFFSNQYKGRSDLFQGLSVWQEKNYQNLQGTYPLLSMTFAPVKEMTYQATLRKICGFISELYSENHFLLEENCLDEEEEKYFRSITMDMDETTASMSLRNLSKYLSRYYGKKVILLLDEYDTPMQEAYIHGYWDEMAQFIRNLFNNSFKTNPYMERVLLTGITRVAKESIFSDFNNVTVVTATSHSYETAFGFTEEEAFAALDEQGLEDKKDDVKVWYDGFTFGRQKDIYNPWSIINYLREKKFGTYWANTSSNDLIGSLVQTGDTNIKQTMEDLLEGRSFEIVLDEQTVFSQMNEGDDAIWSLLLASGYLKICDCTFVEGNGVFCYRLALTNFEVKVMFRNLIRKWFRGGTGAYNDFVKALLTGDKKAMNVYMNRVSLATFNFFDAGGHPSEYAEPERFYHGFVLGLLVELEDSYVLKSNRESGFGRYDVILKPKDLKNAEQDAIILEFKVYDPEDEKDLAETVESALRQIKEKQYDQELIAEGIPKERIRSYGFAFEGKQVRIG